jgi:hypothetical protein
MPIWGRDPDEEALLSENQAKKNVKVNLVKLLAKLGQ